MTVIDAQGVITKRQLIQILRSACEVLMLGEADG